MAELDGDQLEVNSGGLGQRGQIVWIRRDDGVSVAREENDRGVDDVLLPRAPQELARGTAAIRIEWHDLNALKRLRQERVAWATASPYLSDDPTVRQGWLSR